MTRAIRNLLHGPLPERWAGLTDAPSLWRKAPFLLLLAALLTFGCFPGILISRIQPAVTATMDTASRETAPLQWVVATPANPSLSGTTPDR
jgi:NADH-quinone oxidoreductase subunit M